jgi:hypothetical protein
VGGVRRITAPPEMAFGKKGRQVCLCLCLCICVSVCVYVYYIHSGKLGRCNEMMKNNSENNTRQYNNHNRE